MATSERTIEFLLDQLSGVNGVRARKMFGEYALYWGEKVVALVCDDQLFVKITAPGKALVGKRYAEGFPYPGAKASMLVGADDLEDRERLAELIRVTAAALPSAKPKTKTTAKTGSPAKPKTMQKAATPKASEQAVTKKSATARKLAPRRRRP